MATETTSKPRRPKAKKTAPVLVTMVLDRSGSMGTCRKETIECVNSYIHELTKDKGETYLTLRQFDDQHDVIYEATPAAKAATLDWDSYVPRGSTALNDAIGYGIADAEKSAAKLPKNTKHLLVIVTDGYENASTEYTAEAIKAAIADREAEGWTVVYLMANVDLQTAQAASGFYGVSHGNTVSYTSGSALSSAAVARGLYRVTNTTAGTSGTSATIFLDSGVDQDLSDPNESGKK